MGLKGTHVCLTPSTFQKSRNLRDAPSLPRLWPPSSTQAPWSSFANSCSPQHAFLHPHFGPGDWRGKCSQRRKFRRRRVGLRSEQASGWAGPTARGREGASAGQEPARWRWCPSSARAVRVAPAAAVSRARAQAPALRVAGDGGCVWGGDSP